MVDGNKQHSSFHLSSVQFYRTILTWEGNSVSLSVGLPVSTSHIFGILLKRLYTYLAPPLFSPH